jgi:hypothetical protein
MCGRCAARSTTSTDTCAAEERRVIIVGHGHACCAGVRACGCVSERWPVPCCSLPTIALAFVQTLLA